MVRTPAGVHLLNCACVLVKPCEEVATAHKNVKSSSHNESHPVLESVTSWRQFGASEGVTDIDLIEIAFSEMSRSLVSIPLIYICRV